jgi:hypothetical protein
VKWAALAQRVACGHLDMFEKIPYLFLDEFMKESSQRSKSKIERIIFKQFLLVALALDQ